MPRIETVTRLEVGRLTNPRKEKRMRQNVPTLFTLVVVLLGSGTLTVTDSAFGEESAQNKIEMAAAAKVTIDEAIKTASDKIAGQIIEAELERKHDKVIWEVEVVTAENKVMEVHIDAQSGAVIDVEEHNDKNKSGRLKRPRS